MIRDRHSRLNLSTASEQSSLRISESDFFRDFPAMLNMIFLSDSDIGGGLLDMLDEAFYEYNTARYRDTQSQHQSSLSAFSFLSRL